MKEQYYRLTGEEVIKLMNSNENGLSQKEVKRRLEEMGPNKLKEVAKKTIFSKLLDQFKNVMIIILIISAILSAFVSISENEPFTDTIIILFVVFLNAILGVIQESKAEKAIEALKQMSLPYIKVKRDGRVLSIKTEDLVIGDIVLIEAGDYVPADMRIISNHSLRVEEAALTGESIPVDKQKAKIDSEHEIPIADRVNMIYSGSSVVYGRAEAIVTATGMNTELGKIANAIYAGEGEQTPLQKKMDELSKVLSIIVVVIAVIMFVVGYIEGNPIMDVFMLAVSLSVAAIPEGLAAVITITLAIGVQKMAKQKSIIRKLSAVEALGSTEVICSDKTGTLTQNKMTVRKIYIDNKLIDISDEIDIESISKSANILKSNIDIFTKIIMLCNDTKYGEDNGYKVLLGDPTETALISFGEKLGLSKEKLDIVNSRIEEVPFDSSRKMMTTVNIVNNGYMVSTKGAVESILKVCDYIYIDGSEQKLTQQIRDQILQNNLQMAKSALRVLACAYKMVSKTNTDFSEESMESSLVFVGLVGMIDPPRPEAKQAVEECFRAGMTPVMITGDNLDTAIAIAKELGILEYESQAMTGSMIDELSDEELYKKVENIRVYARVSPENKVRIVKAWKKLGRTVAMTGDGVNDAPALKSADIGIGMGITGTEVSKSVSSMILADDNFATIVVAIKEGRRIYNNIQNVIAYLLASNLAEVLIIFIATAFNQTLLLPIQILWINLVTDTIPAIALGFEKEEKDIMSRKPRSSSEKFFTPFLTLRIVIPALIKSIAVFILYYFTASNFDNSVATTSVFLTLSMIEILFAFVCRSDKKSIFQIGIFSNIPMLLCLAGTIILQITVILVPELSSWLKISPLTTNMYGIVLIVSIGTVAILEVVKIILARIFIREKK
ncbi:MAG: cation-translocating P-type ATPase [Clostridia bacterium]|nr:cation-translocating P-type ATPase [Clostridia bacterium]